MTTETTPLPAGLYLVATPIGTARDITLRALDVLGSADVLAAEDTRTLRKLLTIHGIAVGDRPLVAYHDHSGPGVRARLVEAVRGGRSVAYASEAGTPLVADPGFQLVQAMRAEDLPVTAAPGASAVLTALTVAGLPTDRFFFAGFAPTGASARRKWLTEMAAVPGTLVIYEAPGRVGGILSELCEIGGELRRVAVCRELTKRFEEVISGTAAEVRAAITAKPPKGEVVILVDRDRQVAGADEMEAALREALGSMSVKDAAASVAEALGLPRRQVYQAALKIGAAR